MPDCPFNPSGLPCELEKVAAELCEKNYNSSRDEWYYGVKLHAFVSRHTGHLPTPLTLMVSGSAVHDLTAAKQVMPFLETWQPVC